YLILNRESPVSASLLRDCGSQIRGVPFKLTPPPGATPEILSFLTDIETGLIPRLDYRLIGTANNALVPRPVGSYLMRLEALNATAIDYVVPNNHRPPYFRTTLNGQTFTARNNEGYLRLVENRLSHLVVTPDDYSALQTNFANSEAFPGNLDGYGNNNPQAIKDLVVTLDEVAPELFEGINVAELSPQEAQAQLAKLSFSDAKTAEAIQIKLYEKLKDNPRLLERLRRLGMVEENFDITITVDSQKTPYLNPKGQREGIIVRRMTGDFAGKASGEFSVSETMGAAQSAAETPTLPPQKVLNSGGNANLVAKGTTSIHLTNPADLSLLRSSAASRGVEIVLPEPEISFQGQKITIEGASAQPKILLDHAKQGAPRILGNQILQYQELPPAFQEAIAVDTSFPNAVHEVPLEITPETQTSRWSAFGRHARNTGRIAGQVISHGGMALGTGGSYAATINALYNPTPENIARAAILAPMVPAGVSYALGSSSEIEMFMTLGVGVAGISGGAYMVFDGFYNQAKDRERSIELSRTTGVTTTNEDLTIAMGNQLEVTAGTTLATSTGILWFLEGTGITLSTLAAPALAVGGLGGMAWYGREVGNENQATKSLSISFTNFAKTFNPSHPMGTTDNERNNRDSLQYAVSGNFKGGNIDDDVLEKTYHELEKLGLLNHPAFISPLFRDHLPKGLPPQFKGASFRTILMYMAVQEGEDEILAKLSAPQQVAI
ncbi:MAG: hypothetical protein KDK66_02555, partial [Deltaproteobacteria bacterium]|nr:hypothetical protein [Deltaproteobacteria bacterium]